LAIFGAGDADAVHRARRGSFEVHAILIVPAAMAGAFELVFRRQPARRASEMCALRENGVEALLVAHDPDTEVFLELFTDLTDREVVGSPRLEGRRGGEQDAREAGADRGQQRDERKNSEPAPPEASEEVAARPQAAQLR